jgi:hypothetical protein
MAEWSGLEQAQCQDAFAKQPALASAGSSDCAELPQPSGMLPEEGTAAIKAAIGGLFFH